MRLRCRVAVIHPDLGLGGAERLIVDASRALQDEGTNIVDLYTGYHDRSRCFEETRDGTLNVITIAQWLPRTILGRCHAVIAYLKMIMIAIYIVIFSKPYDLILCDQVSAGIPVLILHRYLTNARFRIVFYCHFPDQLLTSRQSLLKKIYRKPLDKFEEWSTSLADIILVNSKFTLETVQNTFKSLRHRDIKVLYPCVDVKRFKREAPLIETCLEYKKRHEKLANAKFILLSINRFERKKDLGFAIKALGELKDKFEDANTDKDKVGGLNNYQLVIAGGYDARLEYCVDYYHELIKLVSDLGLEDNVTFLKSPSDKEKLILLIICDILIYTPEYEHFGIVPLEAMAMSKPVIARPSGGPLETVLHKETGFLVEQLDEYIADLIFRMTFNKEGPLLGAQGHERVIREFSFERFRQKLVHEICFPIE